jgi:hypothetical protein
MHRYLHPKMNRSIAWETTMTSASLRINRTRLILFAALVAVAATATLGWYLNTPRGYVRKVFATTPLPPGSREIGRELRDWSEGPACPYAQLLAAYTTDRPWQEVAEFYQAQLEQAGWGPANRLVLGQDTTTNTAMEQIEARWPFRDAKQSELTLTVANFSQLINLPEAADRTLFTVGVEYIPDADFFRSSELCQD